MALGGEMNGGDRDPRASNGAIGGSTELGATTGAAIASGTIDTTRDDAAVSKRPVPSANMTVPTADTTAIIAASDSGVAELARTPRVR